MKNELVIELRLDISDISERINILNERIKKTQIEYESKSLNEDDKKYIEDIRKDFENIFSHIITDDMVKKMNEDIKYYILSTNK